LRSTRSSGVQEFRSSGVQEFRSSGVQEFRSSGVQEFRSSGVQDGKDDPNASEKPWRPEMLSQRFGRCLLNSLNSSYS
jgi:hypothetical protein